MWSTEFTSVISKFLSIMLSNESNKMLRKSLRSCLNEVSEESPKANVQLVHTLHSDLIAVVCRTIDFFKSRNAFQFMAS